MRKKNNTNRNDHVTNGGIVCAIFSKKASLATKKSLLKSACALDSLSNAAIWILKTKGITKITR